MRKFFRRVVCFIAAVSTVCAAKLVINLVRGPNYYATRHTEGAIQRLLENEGERILLACVFVGTWILVHVVSKRIFAPSRDEKLRLEETPSETALRHATEKRPAAVREYEKKRRDAILASLPEEKRAELLRKMENYTKK